MYIYIIFIIAILAVIALSKLVKEPQYPHFGLQVITLIIIVFAGCRYAVGVDYTTYYNIIHQHNLIGILRTEPLNQLIFLLTAKWDTPFLCFWIYACITYLFAYKACVANSQRPYLSLFIYITLFYLESLGFIRQAVAMTIGLYAFKYIQTQNFKKYCIWIIICTMFHVSSIILLPAYFVYWKLRLKYAIAFIIIITALKGIIFSLLNVLNFYSGYIDKEISGGSKLKYLYPLILSFMVIFHHNIGREKERLYTLCILALPFPFIFPPHTGMRISNYYFIYICFLIPHFFQDDNYKVRLIFTLLFILVFFLYIYVSDYYIPYTFYWN